MGWGLISMNAKSELNLFGKVSLNVEPYTRDILDIYMSSLEHCGAYLLGSGKLQYLVTSLNPANFNQTHDFVFI